MKNVKKKNEEEKADKRRTTKWGRKEWKIGNKNKNGKTTWRKEWKLKENRRMETHEEEKQQNEEGRKQEEKEE